MQIQGATVLVTGASGGLGTAIARHLADRGAHLVITARNVEALDRLAAETGAEVAVADLAKRADVERLAARAASCDVLVANAGIGADPPFADLTQADIDRSIEVNLRSPIVLSHAFAKARVAAGRPGQIVLIGSLSGVAATAGTRLYNATKFGLRGFALSFRQDLDGTGVGVTHVAPSFIRDAGMFADGGIDLPPGVRNQGARRRGRGGGQGDRGRSDGAVRVARRAAGALDDRRRRPGAQRPRPTPPRRARPGRPLSHRPPNATRPPNGGRSRVAVRAGRGLGGRDDPRPR